MTGEPRPFTRRDIRPCAACGKGLLAGRLPLFYEIEVRRLGFDVAAVRREAGLEMMTGNAAIAAALSPNETLTVELAPPRRICVCEACTHEHPILMQIFLQEE